MPNIVGVQFRDTGKVYYFSPKDIQFEVGDGVVVDTAHGLEYGKITIANCMVDDSEITGELKPVVRKATEKDTSLYNSICQRRLPAIREAQEKANKRKLDMKIVDAEFAFDNSKVVFYFTADNRVDFRDMVKELASTFHMRIDLRQIGIRDECKMKGGLGPCGRVCCCKDFLGDFARVSIKMAKNQGLSLNPVKISGLCGRLMCCLKYEDDYYAQTGKFMPKVNSQIQTPNGQGRVEDVDMLRQLVTVRISRENDETELRSFTLEELGITPTYCNKCATSSDAVSDDDQDGELTTQDEE
ncbi:MAG: stage 0 sporulation family protein [Corallococcus sp.]|nr:stage 0 sporulation family protein [Corallococcus sp.]MCM1359873.1 stage 0 sporulation family protein [Corallococcus sp.]MCM1395307.1 stage 0 sporulation family protein [Corallococcus sp.]